MRGQSLKQGYLHQLCSLQSLGKVCFSLLHQHSVDGATRGDSNVQDLERVFFLCECPCEEMAGAVS